MRVPLDFAKCEMSWVKLVGKKIAHLKNLCFSAH